MSPPCSIDHFFVVELAETAGGVTDFALLCATFQSIKSSSSSCRSKVGSDRPVGLCLRPWAHGSTVTSEVLPLQSIDGVSEALAVGVPEVVTVGDDALLDVVGAEVSVAVDVVFAVDVVLVVPEVMVVAV